MKINFRDVKIAVRTLVDALSLEQYKKRAPSRWTQINNKMKLERRLAPG